MAERAHVGENVVIGEGEEIPNETNPDIYCSGLTVIAEDTEVPAGVSIGKNAMVNGKTAAEDYPEGRLESGRTLNKEGSAL